MEEKSKIQIPSWALEPFMIARKQIDELIEVVDITVRSVEFTKALPVFADLLESHQNFQKKYPDVEAKQAFEIIKQSAKEISEQAKKQEEGGYLFLFRQGTINLYSFLEATIKHLVINSIKNSNLVEVEEVSKIKITVGEYESLTGEERYEFIFENFERSLTSGMQYSVSRFQKLLAPFGYSFAVPDNISKSIYELAQVRNNLLHRAGKVDKYFKNNCPWLSYNIGDGILVSNDSFESYTFATGQYLKLLENHVYNHWETKLVLDKKSV